MKFYNNFKKILIFFFLLIISISFLSLFFFCKSYSFQDYFWTVNDNIKSVSSSLENKKIENNNFLNLESASAILIDQSTGEILYNHNIHEKLYPASVTKVMSILLIMENLNNNKFELSTKVPCSKNASSMGGSQIWLDPKEELSVEDMLKAICVNSANDCVVAMAEFIAGSEEGFVMMMNDKAKKLGMNDTNFKNCHGLDEDGHYTSAYDISLMSRELLNNYPEITKYTTIWMDTLRDGKSQLSNTNKLIKYYRGATGLKTGSTSLAKYNLSASAKRDNLSLIAVIMKAPSTKLRFNEAQKLLDYGFNTYTCKSFFKKDELIKKINVTKGIKNEIAVTPEKDVEILIKKNDETKIKQVINLPKQVDSPIFKGQKLGELQFIINNKTISIINLIANEDIKKLNYIYLAKNLIYNWFNLLRSSI